MSAEKDGAVGKCLKLTGTPVMGEERRDGTEKGTGQKPLYSSCLQPVWVRRG